MVPRDVGTNEHWCRCASSRHRRRLGRRSGRSHPDEEQSKHSFLNQFLDFEIQFRKLYYRKPFSPAGWGWDLGDPDPSKPSTLPRTLSRARKMTVATVIAGQVNPIRTTVEQPHLARKSQQTVEQPVVLRFIDSCARDGYGCFLWFRRRGPLERTATQMTAFKPVRA